VVGAVKQEMNKEEALQIFNGTMLGDSSVTLSHGAYPYFTIAKSGQEHLDWLLRIKEALLSLGVSVTPHYPILGSSTSRGKRYEYLRLCSKTCPFMEGQRGRWYPNSVKVVPEDIILTPAAVASWFMDDGSSVWHTMYGERTGGVSADFATYGFSLGDIEKLETGLIGLGITYITRTVDKHVKAGSGIRLRVHGNSVILLMGLIEPFVAISYKTKIKYPIGPVIERH